MLRTSTSFFAHPHFLSSMTKDLHLNVGYRYVRMKKEKRISSTPIGFG